MSRQAARHYTVEDYFAVEESSNTKHEYYGGEIFAMAGASLSHNRITRNVLLGLQARLAGSGCEAFGSDLRVRTRSGLYTYPDVLVVCGEIQLTGDPLETVANPTLVVEVLSDSTRDYDRGEKFALYRSITTLREYVLIEQSPALVQCYAGPGAAGGEATDAWQRRRYDSPGAQVEFTSIGVTLSLAEIYERVDS
jgi:Uma2 family endonuclease